MIHFSKTDQLLRDMVSSCKEQGVSGMRERLDTLMLEAELGKRGQDKPFPVSLGTFVLDGEKYAKVQQDVTVILSAAMKVRKAYYDKDEKVRACLALSREEQELLSYETPQLDSFGAIRFDFFPTDDGLMLTEFNSDNPDIIMVCNEAARSYYSSVLCESARNTLLTPIDNTTLLIRMLEKVHGGSFSSVGIIGPLDRWIIGENNKSVAALEQQGYTAETGNLEDISFDDGVVSLNGVPVDVLRRVAETHFFIDEKEHLTPLFESITSDAVRMVNSLWDRVLGHKSLFSMFTDPSFSYLFTEQEQHVLLQYIPWTRLVSDGTVQKKDGTIVDMKQLMLEQQKQLVLKPAGGAEAKGVYIGSEVEKDVWEKAMLDAMVDTHAWIVQERIWARSVPVLVDTDDQIEIKDATTDISVHAFGTKNGVEFGLVFSRYAFSAINNIISGGGIIFPFEESR